MAELSENKDLLKLGDGNSSSGSDSAPSEDNLNQADLMKNLPPCTDKPLKTKVKQSEDKKSPTKSKALSKVIKAESPIKVQQSPLKVNKFFVPPVLLKYVEPAPDTDPTKKPKKEMRDAVTQTDRSDWQIIKAKLQREKQNSELLQHQQHQSNFHRDK